MSVKRKWLISVPALIAVATLAACGGGSSTNGSSTANAASIANPRVLPPPQASSGFATNETIVRAGTSFRETTIPTLVETSNGTPAAGSESIALEFVTPSLLRLTIDDEVVLLSLSGNEFTGTLRGDRVSLVRVLQNDRDRPVVESAIIGRFGTNPFIGFHTYGIDTNPIEVDARRARATYTGDALVAYAVGTDSTAASGSVTLEANFDANTVSGQIVETETEALGTGVKTGATINLELTAIDENTFTGDVSGGVTTAPNDRVDLTGTYTGRFYGKDAIAAGGTFDASGDASNRLAASGELVVVGGFVAND